MKSAESSFVTAIKGYLIGAANVVPGVSGGTFALITGVFQRIIDSLNAVLSIKSWKLLFSGRGREFWKAIDGGFLLALAVGILVSVFTLARLITFTLANYPVETWALFFGLILASAWYMFADLRPLRPKDIAFALAGVAAGVVICTLSPARTPDSPWFLLVCGAVAVSSMILPGLSGSLVLVLMSKYEFILNAVNDFNLQVLLIFAAGCVVGILAFSKFLHWLMARYERPTMIVLLGFVTGSLVKVWPWSNAEAIASSQGIAIEQHSGLASFSTLTDLGLELHILPAILWCAAGIGAVILIESLSRRSKNQSK